MMCEDTHTQAFMKRTCALRCNEDTHAVRDSGDAHVLCNARVSRKALIITNKYF